MHTIALEFYNSLSRDGFVCADGKYKKKTAARMFSCSAVTECSRIHFLNSAGKKKSVGGWGELHIFPLLYL